jgi:alpha-tubulin suppressor-like RCC1 family protein
MSAPGAGRAQAPRMRCEDVTRGMSPLCLGEDTMIKLLRHSVVVSLAVLPMGWATSAVADPPGASAPHGQAHPGYLRALGELRNARANLQRRGGDPQMRWDEHRAVETIERAIREIREAAITDGKELEEHAPLDERAPRVGRLHEALTDLRGAREAISKEEDGAFASALRARAIRHLDEAIEATQLGIAEAEHGAEHGREPAPTAPTAVLPAAPPAPPPAALPAAPPAPPPGRSTAGNGAKLPIVMRNPDGAAAVSAGTGFAIALTGSGGIVSWNNDGSGNPAKTPFAGGQLTSGVTTISAGGESNGGYGFACVIAAGGGVQCWGDNGYGELGNGSTAGSQIPVQVTGLTSGVTSLSAGAAGIRAACAITAGGAVQCWGYNGGVLGNGTSAGASSVPVQITGFPGPMTAVAVGAGFACALDTGGSVWCWGQNGYGQLGNNSTTASLAPVRVSGLSRVTALVAGTTSAYALTASGVVESWGQNNLGQLGNGTNTNSSVPVQVVGLAGGATAVTASEGTACAITSGGALECWGNNNYGQLGNNTTTNSPTPIPVETLGNGVISASAGWGFTCASTTSGGVWCWGVRSHVPIHVTGFPG